MVLFWRLQPLPNLMTYYERIPPNVSTTPNHSLYIIIPGLLNYPSYPASYSGNLPNHQTPKPLFLSFWLERLGLRGGDPTLAYPVGQAEQRGAKEEEIKYRNYVN